MENRLKAKAYLKNLIDSGVEEIKIVWEGGNDDGSYYLYADDKHIDVDWDKKDGSYALIDYFADEIGYGSFAGDYNTNGEAYYNKETGQFIGSDNCETVEEFDYKLKKPLVITIPKDLWFDSVSIHATGYDGYTDEISVKLIINNGPVVQDHIDFELSAQNYIRSSFNELFDNENEVRDAWIDRDFNREDLSLDKKGNPYIQINSIAFTQYVADDKEIVIQL